MIQAAAMWGRPLSICGAMASDPLAAILLLGLGVRDFSMEAAAIPEIRRPSARDPGRGRGLRHGGHATQTAEEVEHAVAAAFAPRLYDLLTASNPSHA